mgnify:CR=1 FL=1
MAKRDVMIIKMLTSCRVRSPGSHGPHDAPSATSCSSLRVGGGVHYLVIPGSDLAQSAFHPKLNINCILSMLIIKLEECRLQGVRKLAVNANVSG